MHCIQDIFQDPSEANETELPWETKPATTVEYV